MMLGVSVLDEFKCRGEDGCYGEDGGRDLSGRRPKAGIFAIGFIVRHVVASLIRISIGKGEIYNTEP
jgi:hypothetical protein